MLSAKTANNKPANRETIQVEPRKPTKFACSRSLATLDLSKTIILPSLKNSSVSTQLVADQPQFSSASFTPSPKRGSPQTSLTMAQTARITTANSKSGMTATGLTHQSGDISRPAAATAAAGSSCFADGAAPAADWTGRDGRRWGVAGATGSACDTTDACWVGRRSTR